MNTSPCVSIIMPVYNAGSYLRESLDCLLRQSCPDFEVICVDDGSTDDSLAILHEYASRDPRFSVYTQNHQYAGEARNLGIRHARGEYLQFVDADDLFSQDLVAAPYALCEQTQADICIYEQEIYDQKTGRRTPITEECIQDLYKNDVFSRRDDPRQIFSVTLPGPCNKMFRKEFILCHEIWFQSLHHSNDVAFVLTALALAEKITLLSKTLYTYRQHQASSQHNAGKDPFCFYTALLEVRDRLKKYGLYEELKPAFLNFCAYNIVFNLNNAALPRTFELLYTFIQQQGLKELELRDLPDDYFYAHPEEELAARMNTIQKESIFDYVGKYGPDFGIVQQRMRVSTLKSTIQFQLQRGLKKISRLLKA